MLPEVVRHDRSTCPAFWSFPLLTFDSPDLLQSGQARRRHRPRIVRISSRVGEGGLGLRGQLGPLCQELGVVVLDDAVELRERVLPEKGLVAYLLIAAPPARWNSGSSISSWSFANLAKAATLLAYWEAQYPLSRQKPRRKPRVHVQTD